MNLTQMVLNRELLGNRWPQNQIMSSVIQTHPLVCDYMKVIDSAINYIDIESIDNKYSLIGCNDGSVSINEIIDEKSGELNVLYERKFVSIINRCQWYPNDTGMFSILSSDRLKLIDTNSLNQIESYSFPKCKLYWSDWNSHNPTLIAVACSSSAIRIADIRSGSSLQQITCSSMTGTAAHQMTRILWLESDGLVAGDSSGYLHIYDIRRPNRSVTVLGSDYTSMEPITCLQFSKNRMSVFTCHGLSNKLNLWHFKNSDLINSDINFQCPIIRSKQVKHNMNKSYIRCQIYATDQFVFTPSEQKQFGRDVLSYDISTGIKAHTLSTSREGTFRSSGPNCVTGLEKGSLLLYSGGHKRLCAWTPKINYESDNHLDKYHTDKWSDSE